MAEFYSENGQQKKGIVEKGIKIAELGERIKDKVSTYSKGMTRKLLLARVLMIDRKLAILAVTLVVTTVVTYLWNLIVHGQSTVDWGLSFRLAIVLGIVLPATRGLC